jgi:TPR repeat protein
MINLGNMYGDGRGVAKDEVEAVRWFRNAADVGDPGGMAILGYAYENGKGVLKDQAQGVLWYRKAADGGNEFAIAALRRLGQSPSAR